MGLLVEVRFLEHNAASLIKNSIWMFYSNTPEISGLSPKWSSCSCTGDIGCATVPPHIPLLGGTGCLFLPVTRSLLRALSTTDLCYINGEKL